MLREGRAAQLYSPEAQQAVQQRVYQQCRLRRGPLPYIHPPFEALIFLPLTVLSYSYAFAVWNVVNLGMLLGIALLLRRSLSSLSEIPAWEWVLAFLAFFPVFSNFLQGQDAILLLLLFFLGFGAMGRDADFLAGCWFGLAVFKYHFALPLIVILVLWRRKKLALGFIATASAAILLSLWIVGWQGALRYPAYAWSVVSTSGHGQTPLGLTPNLLGLVTGWPFLDGMTTTLRWIVSGLGELSSGRRSHGGHCEMMENTSSSALPVPWLQQSSSATTQMRLIIPLILPLALVWDYGVSANLNGHT